MASKIDIASNALVLIGDTEISSFADAGAGALAANALYDIAYETMLASHRWTFATGKAQLSKLAASPLNEWQNAFQIPTNLKLVVVYGVYPDTRYTISEDKVFSDSDTLAIDFVFKPDESTLPAYFITALQFRLAANFAVFISDDNTLAQVYEDKANAALSTARGIDSMSRSTQPIKSSPFIAVR